MVTLIELFSGIGSQTQALKNLGSDFCQFIVKCAFM